MSERNKIDKILIIFRKIKLLLQISLHSRSENQNTLDTRCGGALFLISNFSKKLILGNSRNIWHRAEKKEGRKNNGIDCHAGIFLLNVILFL